MGGNCRVPAGGIVWGCRNIGGGGQTGTESEPQGGIGTESGTRCGEGGQRGGLAYVEGRLVIVQRYAAFDKVFEGYGVQFAGEGA